MDLPGSGYKKCKERIMMFRFRRKCRSRLLMRVFSIVLLTGTSTLLANTQAQDSTGSNAFEHLADDTDKKAMPSVSDIVDNRAFPNFTSTEISTQNTEYQAWRPPEFERKWLRSIWGKGYFLILHLK
jgi:hypothetical protein